MKQTANKQFPLRRILHSGMPLACFAWLGVTACSGTDATSHSAATPTATGVSGSAFACKEWGAGSPNAQGSATSGGCQCSTAPLSGWKLNSCAQIYPCCFTMNTDCYCQTDTTACAQASAHGATVVQSCSAAGIAAPSSTTNVPATTAVSGGSSDILAAGSSGCSYADAAKYNGYGYNNALKKSCAPQGSAVSAVATSTASAVSTSIASDILPAGSSGCSYADAAKYNGYGYNNATKKSCAPQ